MIELQDLSVGQVSGMIAAAIFLVQFLIPFTLPVILLGLLRLRSSALTATAISWSVISRFIHSSLWPIILQTDSAATLSTSKTIVFISFLRTFSVALIAVAAIVTPLGLYEGLVSEDAAQPQAFHYIKDLSPIGLGTPPRSNTTWSRICGFVSPVACPNSLNNITRFENATGEYIHADWYDSHIPQHVIDVFQSGLKSLSASVSSIFDIEYRSYTKTKVLVSESSIPVDNGTAYTIGSYRPLSSFILTDAIVPIEGLIVDIKNGGIAFRNHSAPTWRQFGSTWSEDLLFIGPETVCVDTNLTLDFMIPTNQTTIADDDVSYLVLTDMGGFVDFNRTYPYWDKIDTQNHPELWLRAYKAAWLNNALSMAWMNVTNVANDTTGQKAFKYLNSTLGKQFPLHYADGSVVSTTNKVEIKPSALRITSNFGGYLDETDTGLSNISTIGNQTFNYSFPSKPAIYPNQYNLSLWSNFTDPGIVCKGTGGKDLANITNMAAMCGLLYGAPQRQDGSSSLLFDPGSSWSIPMYSCVSVAKATIKTVSFTFNGTDDLSSLSVTNVAEKTYPDDESKPLWGVENTDVELRDSSPLWGLVTPESATQLNISTLRKESLYLPGYDASFGAIRSGRSTRNLPGVDFPAAALEMAYTVSAAESGSADYSGGSNLAMYRLWQDLSREPESAAKIINLIWTDIAANLVIGTKSLDPGSVALSKRDEASTGDVNTPKVTSYVRRIKYRYVYGIPAFLTLLLTAIVSVTSTVLLVLGPGRLSNMRNFLNQTSTGRLLLADTSVPGPQAGNISTKKWRNIAGTQQFTLDKDGWTKNGGYVAVTQVSSPEYKGR